MGYVPWAPGKPADLAPCVEALKAALPKDTAFIRFDPPWYTECSVDSNTEVPAPLPAPFVHAASDTQPPDSVLLDLSRSEEDILEGMHSTCRYNCRLGTRKVEVREKGAEGVETF
jgi:hypothetical protein